MDVEDPDTFYDEAPSVEVEEIEEKVVDRASASRTIAELEAEIHTLRRLEGLAQKVHRSGTDRPEVGAIVETVTGRGRCLRCR